MIKYPEYDSPIVVNVRNFRITIFSAFGQNYIPLIVTDEYHAEVISSIMSEIQPINFFSVTNAVTQVPSNARRVSIIPSQNTNLLQFIVGQISHVLPQREMHYYLDAATDIPYDLNYSSESTPKHGTLVYVISTRWQGPYVRRAIRNSMRYLLSRNKQILHALESRNSVLTSNILYPVVHQMQTVDQRYRQLRRMTLIGSLIYAALTSMVILVSFVLRIPI